MLTPSIDVSHNFERTDLSSAELPDDAPENLQAAPGKEENNGFLEVTPAFRARAERPGTRLDLNLSTRARGSSARSELRAFDESARISLQQNITPRFIAIAGGSYRTRDGQNPLDRDDPGEAQFGRPDLNEGSADLTLAYSVTAMSQISVGYSAFARDYQGSQSRGSGNRDYDIGAWTLGYSQSLSPLDRLGLSLSYQKLSFGQVGSGGGFQVNEQDDEVTALTASWTRALTPMWTADLSAGVRYLKTDGGGFRGVTSEIGNGAPEDESTGFIGGISFRRETEWNTTRIGYRRETRPSGGVGTSLDVDSFDFSFTQQLMRNFSFQLRGEYQLSKSASDAFRPVAPEGLRLVSLFPFQAETLCGSGDVTGSLNGQTICLGQDDSVVDTSVLRLGVQLNWRWTRGFVTFLSYDFRDQDVEGIIGGRDRDTSRVRLGFRYAYDYQVY